MATDLLTTFSNQLADAVAAAAPSVVQVQGRRRPASGLVYADDVVLTTVRALGREDGLHVRRDDGRTLDAELAGWDPTTSLAVLRVAGLGTPPIAPAASPPRVGHLALAVARSWSNAVTASAGHRVGDRRTAADRPPPRDRPGDPHDRADARRLRRRRVRRHRRRAARRRDRRRRSAASASSFPRRSRGRRRRRVLEHGSLKRGYLGIAGQPVALPESQQRRRTGASRRCSSSA